jgi:hypothetical protein
MGFKLRATMIDHKRVFTASEAEKHLQAALGERDGYWRVFLQNNRRPDRQPAHVIPYAVERGRPVYVAGDLDAFIAKQKAESLDRGKVPGRLDDALRAIGGWPTGRPWAGWITPQVEEGTSVTFVRVHLADPLAIYRLDPDQARAVARDLIEAADQADRAGEVAA